jgi:hypothetical protein
VATGDGTVLGFCSAYGFQIVPEICTAFFMGYGFAELHSEYVKRIQNTYSNLVKRVP